MSIIGKTVIAKVMGLARDNQGKRLSKDILTEVRGVITYLGPNPYLDFKLQATINRTPFEIKSINDIKVI